MLQQGVISVLCTHHANVSLHPNSRRMEMEAEWVSIVESNK